LNFEEPHPGGQTCREHRRHSSAEHFMICRRQTRDI
jgi:uncharacterized cupin superfamily protein